ncbi:hypothetical protein Btru_021566 [Bulinus truncatus]|nr:hypothetical protein Btru_021566 [Bulinus truncatus]
MEETHTNVAFEHYLTDHCNNLIDKLYLQWKTVSFCDLFIVASEKYLAVHACVLSAFSSTVASQISKSSNLLMDGKLSLPYIMKVEFSYETMDTIVTALYTGIFRPPVDFLTEILNAVEWLGISELSEALKKHLDDHNALADLERKIENTDVCAILCTQMDLSDFVDDKEINGNKILTLSVSDPTCHEMVPASAGSFSKDQEISLEKSARRTARKRKSIPYRYSQEIYVLNPLKKEKPSEKLNYSVTNGNMNDCLKAQSKDKSTHISSAVENHADLLSSKLSLKVKLTRIPSAELTKLISKNGKSEKANFEEIVKSVESPEISQKMPQTHNVTGAPEISNDAQNGAEIIQDVPQNHDVTITNNNLSEKLDVPPKNNAKMTKKKMNSSDVDPGSKIVTTTVIEEVPDNDPIKGQLDLLFDSLQFKKCEKCFKKFTDIGQYTEHIINHPVFKCNECSEEFYRKYLLTKHKRDVHYGRPYLKCRLCEYGAPQESALKKHSREVHGESCPFRCLREGCTFKTTRYFSLESHMLIHSEEKTFVCDKCDKSFSQKAGLESHKKACYRMEAFLCDLCGQGFNLQGAMNAHRRNVHFGEKRYTCKACSKPFSDHRNYKRHLRIHENAFPYSCPVCRQQFRHSNSLKFHLSSRHKEIKDIHGVINKAKLSNYKRPNANYRVEKATSGKRTKTLKKRKAASIQTFQLPSVSGGSLPPPPHDESSFDASNGLDIDEDMLSDSIVLDNFSLVSKQLDLSGESTGDVVDLDTL